MTRAQVERLLYPPQSWSSNVPTLVVLSDSPLQPALPLVRSVVQHSLEQQEQVVLVLAELQERSILGGAGNGESGKESNSGVTALDAWSFSSAASLITALSTSSSSSSNNKKLIVLDSLNELLTLFTPRETLLLVRAALEASNGGRVVLVEHSSTPLTLDVNVLLAPSGGAKQAAHLVLLPTELPRSLRRDYGLSLPRGSDDEGATTDDKEDTRAWDFLARFRVRREWAGLPSLVIAEEHWQEKEQWTLDLLGLGVQKGSTALPAGQEEDVGRCCLEYFLRGIGPAAEDKKGGARPGQGAGKKPVAAPGIRRGLLGLRLEAGNSSRVQVVNLEAVLPLPAATRPLEPSSQEQEKKDDPLSLPFNLSLTDAQRKEREKVELPFLKGALREMELGGGPDETRQAPQGGVLYEPDEGDDMDYDDPDEDLEI